MKQLKFFAFALTVLMGISLTSCLDSESNPIQDGSTVVRYNAGAGSYFTSAYGQRIVPTDPMSLITLSSGYYDIYYTFNRDEVSQDSKEISVTLKEAPSRLTDMLIQDSKEMVGNAALAAFAYGNGFFGYEPTVFDSKVMIYPALFWSIQTSDEKVWKEELAKHTFDISYEVNQQDKNTLILNVEHSVSDKGDESAPQRKTLQLKLFAVDISAGIAAVKAQGGELKKIRLKGKCSGDSYTFDDLNKAKETSFTIDCTKYSHIDF